MFQQYLEDLENENFDVQDFLEKIFWRTNSNQKGSSDWDIGKQKKIISLNTINFNAKFHSCFRPSQRKLHANNQRSEDIARATATKM